jgi:hypothetical protein
MSCQECLPTSAIAVSGFLISLVSKFAEKDGAEAIASPRFGFTTKFRPPRMLVGGALEHAESAFDEPTLATYYQVVLVRDSQIGRMDRNLPARAANIF